MNISFEYKNFKVDHKNVYWLLFFNDKLLVKESNGKLTIPVEEDLETINAVLSDNQHICMIDEYDCYASELSSEECIPEGFSLIGLRQIFGQLEDRWFWIAGRAYHLISWMKNNKFCGRCGGAMDAVIEERAAKCSSCGNIVYPRISPAVIVAIIKDDMILLARAKRFAPGWFSVVAGFVEAGETLEEAVKREVREEVGIEVQNIRYFGSQPWPFPDSLMMGFTAEYLSGEIVIDNVEIVEAGWYTRDNMPEIPGKISIARKLIDWYLDKA